MTNGNDDNGISVGTEQLLSLLPADVASATREALEAKASDASASDIADGGFSFDPSEITGLPTKLKKGRGFAIRLLAGKAGEMVPRTKRYGRETLEYQKGVWNQDGKDDVIAGDDKGLVVRVHNTKKCEHIVIAGMSVVASLAKGYDLNNPMRKAIRQTLNGERGNALVTEADIKALYGVVTEVDVKAHDPKQPKVLAPCMAEVPTEDVYDAAVKAAIKIVQSVEAEAKTTKPKRPKRGPRRRTA